MAAPKGNSYYLLASGWKRPKRYKPDALWVKVLEYVQWVGNNPLKEEKVFGSGMRMTVNKMRAMTISGFCVFAHMSRNTWNEYEGQQAYQDIIGRAKDIFFCQKLEGAAAELLNPNIIARELQLAQPTVKAQIEEGEGEEKKVTSITLNL
jgi:hypothetical protein